MPPAAESSACLVDPKSGSLRVRNQAIQTPDVVRSDAVVIFHKEMLDRAKEALDSQTSKERCLSSLTVAVRKKDLPEAFRRVHAFRGDLDTLFTRGRPYDSVYQLNMQLFRLDTDV